MSGAGRHNTQTQDVSTRQQCIECTGTRNRPAAGSETAARSTRLRVLAGAQRRQDQPGPARTSGQQQPGGQRGGRRLLLLRRCSPQCGGWVVRGSEQRPTRLDSSPGHWSVAAGMLIPSPRLLLPGACRRPPCLCTHSAVHQSTMRKRSSGGSG